MRKALRAAQWVVAIIVSLPLVPLAMSLCAGAFLVVVAVDKGERKGRWSVLAGLLSVCVSALGIFIIYELVQLIWGS